MKLALHICAVVSLATSANAIVIVADSFDYPDGSLVPNGGWANHSGAAGDLLVSGGQVVVQHGIPSEDANIGFAAVGGTLFYGIDFSVNASGQILGTDNEYFAHFKEGFNFSARLDVVPAPSGGDYSVGIASDDSVADTIWPNDLTFGQTYRAVVGYDQDANIAELWLDASLISDQSILGDNQADPGDSVVQFALRQSDSDLNETVLVDNLIVGTTFQDVVPAPGAMALGALGGVACVRRRRSR